MTDTALREKITSILGTAKYGHWQPEIEMDGEIHPPIYMHYTTAYAHQLLTDPILDIIHTAQSEAVREFAEKIGILFGRNISSEEDTLTKVLLYHVIDQLLSTYQKEQE